MGFKPIAIMLLNISDSTGWIIANIILCLINYNATNITDYYKPINHLI